MFEAESRLIDNLKMILNDVDVTGLKNMQHLVMVAKGLDTLKDALSKKGEEHGECDDKEQRES